MEGLCPDKLRRPRQTRNINKFSSIYGQSISGGHFQPSVSKSGALRKTCAARRFSIFPEKLYDNEDNLHSPENRVYSPKELMEMDWLDACVHGKLPHYDELDVKTRTVLAINGLDNVKGLEK